ncbi:hypothetical protein COO60DRAFT_1661866 [Scenedesmus sp. NREL 46B-D3]|nr:hypothetical protein COO60DRAFT_1661866 [Scenedesmus sp. NREL 46B-D3]
MSRQVPASGLLCPALAELQATGYGQLCSSSYSSGSSSIMAARVRTADDDQEIAKIRVITQVSSAAYQRSGPPAKILAQRWVAFVEAVQNDTAEKAQEAYNRLLLAVTDMELLGRKLAASQTASKRELDTYAQKQQQLHESIGQANELIEVKKQQLAEARVWRQQQEEYEVLRKQITAEQPRHETQQQIDAVDRDIDNIRADIRRQQLTYEVIAKKCAAVQHQVEDLLNSFPSAADAPAERDREGAQPMQLDA